MLSKVLIHNLSVLIFKLVWNRLYTSRTTPRVEFANFFAILDHCGENSAVIPFYSYTGWLFSENYPSDYSHNLDCYWNVTMPSGVVALYFSFFDTFNSNDYLKVDILYLLTFKRGFHYQPKIRKFYVKKINVI